MQISGDIGFTAYRALEAVSISALKELRRSPLHYRHNLLHGKTTAAMTLGTAAHCATLEPHRFADEYAVWDQKTAAGRSAPRLGKAWEAFVEASVGRQILTAEEHRTATSIATAVHHHAAARPYLVSGDAEVSMQWEMHGRRCKGRVDWLQDRGGKTVIVGLKTARDCRHYPFGAVSARLGYSLQWAWYHDGWLHITGESPAMVEIVVESAAPHAVAVYRINEDVLAHGRDEYLRLLELLDRCEQTGHWPGPVEAEEELTLPSWAYGTTEDDLSELGLEA